MSEERQRRGRYLPPVAVAASDAFYSTICARIAHGVLQHDGHGNPIAYMAKTARGRTGNRKWSDNLLVWSTKRSSYAT